MALHRLLTLSKSVCLLNFRFFSLSSFSFQCFSSFFNIRQTFICIFRQIQMRSILFLNFIFFLSFSQSPSIHRSFIELSQYLFESPQSSSLSLQRLFIRSIRFFVLNRVLCRPTNISRDEAPVLQLITLIFFLNIFRVHPCLLAV